MPEHSSSELPPGLTQCPDCGKVLASMGGHDCDAKHDSTNLTREEREALIEQDDRPGDTRVLSFQRSHSYHEMLRNDQPLCNPGNVNSTERPFSRHRAQSRGKYPCRDCEEIQKEIVTDLRSTEPNGCCSEFACHVCSKEADMERPATERGTFNGHCLCDDCAQRLAAVIS